MRALVVFHDKDSRHWANRWLKPGFWHVFVCVCDGPAITPEWGEAQPYWVRIDAQDGIPAVEVVALADFDLASFYRQQGLTVIEVETAGRRPATPLVVANCVGVAKLVLGIRAPWVVTPWQLYNHVLGREMARPSIRLEHADAD